MAIHVGHHVTLNGRWLDTFRKFYKDASASIVYTVAAVDRTKAVGKARFYVDDPRDGSRLCLYRRHLFAVPRCPFCGNEGHTKAKASRNTCPELKRQWEEEKKERAEKKARAKAEKKAARSAPAPF